MEEGKGSHRNAATEGYGKTICGQTNSYDQNSEKI
ncbi:hypothetical protein ES703_31346 [subsurface metagenome]